ncbi:MAG TPA: cytidylate kinase-like family protein [Dehalococcoidia bacterium]|nr:cytidylate kinase-like family protein [Dehalococcoidia bacterium]
MTIVTVSGNVGTGARDVARMIADALGLDYVDQALLVDAARRLGVPVERVSQRDERTQSLGERMAAALRSFLERSATIGAADPMIGAPSIEVMLGRPYEEEIAEATESDVSDKRYGEALAAIIQEAASRGDVVIVGRGSHAVLQGHPVALHVNLVAPRDARVRNLVRREGLDPEDASRRVERSERGRIAYHRKLFKCEPDDPLMYHMTLNAALLDVETMSRSILACLADDASSLRGGTP